MRNAPTDDDLLALLEQVEARKALLGRAEEDEEDVPDLEGDACPHCLEPALALEACDVCGEEGCLPRDDWRPGVADPCLTRCARCGNLVHLDCAAVDEAGNPVCCGPRRPADE